MTVKQWPPVGSLGTEGDVRFVVESVDSRPGASRDALSMQRTFHKALRQIRVKKPPQMRALRGSQGDLWN